METVAATDADTVNADTATAAVTMVTTEDAARLAGVSVRTIRRWIQHGHLAAVESDRGKLVSPADIPEARTRAGRGHSHDHSRIPNGYDRGHDNMATDETGPFEDSKELFVCSLCVLSVIECEKPAGKGAGSSRS